MRRLLALGPFMLGASLLGMPTAQAAEPVPMLHISDDLPPPSARANTLLLGTAVFGGFYGASLAASYGWDDDPGAADLRIPLVGPWLKVGQTTLCANLPQPEPGKTCSDPVQVIGGVLAVISGIGQLGGFALLLEGTFMRTRRPSAATALWQNSSRYRLHSPDVRADWRRSHVDFTVVPVLTASTLGAVVTGSF